MSGLRTANAEATISEIGSYQVRDLPLHLWK